MLLSQTELHQLLKLPILVEHFGEHQLRDKKITVLAFLKEHYVGHTIIDNDDQRDRQLPFKSTDCVTTVSYVYEEPVYVTIEQTVFFVKKEFNLHKQFLPNSTALDAIFQPPRVA